jgi:hypothetical protein
MNRLIVSIGFGLCAATFSFVVSGRAMEPGRTEIPEEVVATVSPTCAPWDGRAVSIVAHIPLPVDAVLRVMIWNEGVALFQEGKGVSVEGGVGIKGLGMASLCALDGKNCQPIHVWVKFLPEGMSDVPGRILLGEDFYLPNVRAVYDAATVPLCG